MLKGLSLFSNCGAGDVGYRAAGIEFRVMAELDPHRLAVALANHPGAIGVPGDLRTTWGTVVERWRAAEGSAHPDLLAACPPCQGMSSARGGLGRHDDHAAGGRDERNLLVTVIEAVALKLKPRAIVVENVPAFLSRAVPHPETGGPVSAALLLIEALKDDYAVSSIVADLADWGVPQQRKRAFLTFIRRDEPGAERLAESVAFPVPTNASDWGGQHITVREALSSLNAAALDAASETSARDSENPMHFVPVWDARRYAMVKAIPPHTGLGAWSNAVCLECGAVVNDTDAAMCEGCDSPLPRPIVQEGKKWRLVNGFRTSSYTRMKSDAPAATVTTASGHMGSDKTLHPWENRVLSPYECAYLQTLPSDFQWGDAMRRWGHTNVREMIGEAVPPRFTRLHGLAIRSVLNDGETADLLPMADPRVVRASASLQAARDRAVTAGNLPDQLQPPDAAHKSPTAVGK